MLDLAVNDRERLLDLERMVVEVALLLLHDVAQPADRRLQRLHHRARAASPSAAARSSAASRIAASSSRTSDSNDGICATHRPTSTARTRAHARMARTRAPPR